MKLLLSAAGVVLHLYCVVEAGIPTFTPEFSCAKMSIKYMAYDPLDHNISTVVITLTPMIYKDAETIEIDIYDDEEFRNALVRTRCTSCSNPRQDIGSFEKLDMDLELFDCDNIKASAAIAFDYSSKKRINMIFKRKPGVQEDFFFEVSVMKDDIHWFRSLTPKIVLPEDLPEDHTQNLTEDKEPNNTNPDSGNRVICGSSSSTGVPSYHLQCLVVLFVYLDQCFCHFRLKER